MVATRRAILVAGLMAPFVTRAETAWPTKPELPMVLARKTPIRADLIQKSSAKVE
jgi:hypothetical protein